MEGQPQAVKQKEPCKHAWLFLFNGAKAEQPTAALLPEAPENYKEYAIKLRHL